MDRDTFLTTLYVIADDFCQSRFPQEPRSAGRPASLICSEVITLSLFGQWVQFKSERAFYRFAEYHLRAAFPSLPDRAQFNRRHRTHRDAITAFGLFLVESMKAQECCYEALDSTAAVTRDAKRRGAGWLPGQADIGWSNRLGWYEGFHVLLAVTPSGVITGFGFGSASTHDQLLAETLFAKRAEPSPLLQSCGLPARGAYVADKGFAGAKPHMRWKEQYQVEVVTPPHQNSKKLRWPKSLRRWLASLRQIIETVNEKRLEHISSGTRTPSCSRWFSGSLGRQSEHP
jgi:hypothetical protein